MKGRMNHHTQGSSQTNLIVFVNQEIQQKFLRQKIKGYKNNLFEGLKLLYLSAFWLVT